MTCQCIFIPRVWHYTPVSQKINPYTTWLMVYSVGLGIQTKYLTNRRTADFFRYQTKYRYVCFILISQERTALFDIITTQLHTVQYYNTAIQLIYLVLFIQRFWTSIVCTCLKLIICFSCFHNVCIVYEIVILYWAILQRFWKIPMYYCGYWACRMLLVLHWSTCLDTFLF